MQVSGPVVHVQVLLESETARTMYDVIVAPPLLAGAVQISVACALPAVPAKAVGAPGTVRGVTEVALQDLPT